MRKKKVEGWWMGERKDGGEGWEEERRKKEELGCGHKCRKRQPKKWSQDWDKVSHISALFALAHLLGPAESKLSSREI